MSDLVSSPRVNSQHLPVSRAEVRRDGRLVVIGWVGILLMGVWWFNQLPLAELARLSGYKTP